VFLITKYNKKEYKMLTLEQAVENYGKLYARELATIEKENAGRTPEDAAENIKAFKKAQQEKLDKILKTNQKAIQ